MLISDQATDTIELNVPGGAAGVNDTTLSISDVVVRTTTLVFGP